MDILNYLLPILFNAFNFSLYTFFHTNSFCNYSKLMVKVSLPCLNCPSRKYDLYLSIHCRRPSISEMENKSLLKHKGFNTRSFDFHNKAPTNAPLIQTKNKKYFCYKRISLDWNNPVNYNLLYTANWLVSSYIVENNYQNSL